MNDNDTDPAGRWAGPVGRGMMNAEQLQAMKINQERAAAERIRRENAVALLAEKEREIAGLRHRIHNLEQHNQYFFRCESGWCNPTPDCNPALDTLKQVMELREAAEERLKEAQAEIKRLQNLFAITRERSTS